MFNWHIGGNFISYKSLFLNFSLYSSIVNSTKDLTKIYFEPIVTGSFIE